MSLAHIHSLPLDQKIGQLFFIGIPGPDLDDRTIKLIEDISPGGVCLFSRNIREAGQARHLLDGIRDLLQITPFLSLDQEGGSVDRLRRIVTPMPPAASIRTPEQAAAFARMIAETTRELGFNMDFAPVVDISGPAGTPAANGLGSRTFGSTPDEVTVLASAFLGSLQDAGIMGCPKHFPGLGASRVDSHDTLPSVDVSRADFERELKPYRSLIAAGTVHAIMVAHAAYPQLDLQETGQNGKLIPSSLSHNFVTKLLRDDLGYGGLAVTDDLEMGAIVNSFGIGEACRMAVLAGEDMLAICAGTEAIYEGFAAVSMAVESGEIPETLIDEALTRIAAAKSMLHEPPGFDTSRLNALSLEIQEFISSLDRT